MDSQLTGYRQQIFQDRYSLKDASGQALETTPEEMWKRVAKGIASVEQKENRNFWEGEFEELLSGFKFIPGGRILAGAGSGHQVTYYNCFVIPSPEDSRGGIFANIALMTEIMARGGGVGVNLSTLRPRGAYIKTVNGYSSGPCSWAELYSVTTGGVIQQGGSRRGALMIVLDDDHPDIAEFITAKRIDPLTNKPVALNHANISVAISDAFMQAVKEDGMWQTQFPTKAVAQQILEENPDAEITYTYHKSYRARDLWHMIAEAAWRSAEPGLLFMERAQREANTWYYEKIRATNPCGEQFLGPYGVCNLGAMNLSAYVDKDDDGVNFFRFGALSRDVVVAMRFLDNVIDANFYFLDENAKAQLGTRRTGLGTMGIADTLIKLGYRYGSPDADEFIELVYSVIRNNAYRASIELAAEKGSFPKFDAEKYLEGPFIKTLPDSIQEDIAKYGIRNATLLTQAPTGTTSTLAGASSGIEPIFAFFTQRQDRLGTHVINHPLVEAYYAEHGADSELPDYFVESSDLTPEDHIKVQARIQQFTDSSISKTVNGPNENTVEDVERLYMLAYDTGCKGVTYYRDGSRDAVLTNMKPTVTPPDAPGAKEEQKLTQDTPAKLRHRPDVVHGFTRRVKAPEGTVNVTVNSDQDGPIEVFINIGRNGSDIAALAEALGRLISLNLQIPSPMSPQERLDLVTEQLSGIGGSRTVGFGPNRVVSLPDATAHALSNAVEVQELLDNDIPAPQAKAKRVKTGNICPECSQLTLVKEEGCTKCLNEECGFSAC